MAASRRGGALGQVRLVDVAARAGVSMKTVSNVVRGNPHVSPEMRERVQRAIDALGYRPNVTARRLATGRTGMLALALPEMDQPYFAEIARYIAELAAEFGFRVVIEQTLGDVEAERAVISDRDHGLVDGVVFNPVRMTTAEIAGLERDLPLVLIGEAARPSTSDHVMIDNVAAAREAVAYLLRSGRRRIAFLGMVDDDPSDANALRLQGLVDAHRDAGMDHDPALVLSCATYTVSASAEALGAILGNVAVDAVLCREDRFAVGALRALNTAGMRVPDDVAVIGWDDTALAGWSVPTITSVAPDKRELARVALGLVRDRIGGHQGDGRHVIVPHTLTIRASA